MALDLATIGIALDTSGLKSGQAELGKTTAAANKTADAADKMAGSFQDAAGRWRAASGRFLNDTEKSAAGLSDLNSRFGAFGNVLKGLGLGLFLQQAGRLADEYTKFNAQLKLATDSTAQYAKASQEVQRIAQATQGGLSATGVLYARITQNTKELGVSQSQVAKITETVGLSLRTAGASSTESSSAMLQLSQAFGAGALRGEEFNAIAESAPGLLGILAKSMGVTRGELKKLAEEGKLTTAELTKAFTSETVLESLRKQADGIKTISGSYTLLRDKIVLFVGEADKASGASTGFANVLGTLAKAVDFAGKTIADNQVLFAGIGAVLGSAALAAGLYATAAALGVIKVQFALLGATMLANPIALALITGGAVVAGGSAAFSAYKKTADGIEQTNRALEKQRGIIEKNLASGRLDAGQKEANLATLEKVNKAIKDNSAQLSVLSGGAIDNRAEDARMARFTSEKAAAAAALAASKAAKKPKTGGAKPEDPDADFKSYIENLQKQIEKTRELTVAEQVLADIQAGRISVSAGQTTRLMTLAKEIDATKQAIAIADERAARRRADDIAAVEGVRAIEEAERSRLNALLDNTPSAILQKQRSDVEFLTDALERGQISEAVYLEGVTSRLNLTGEKLRENKTLADELGLSFSSAFEDAIVGGKGLSGILKGLGEDITRIIARKSLTEPLGNAISGLLGGTGGGGAGGIGGIFSSLFSGLGFANGGNPPVGQASMVGERGPELFVPRSAGTIIPNEALGQRSQPTQVINFYNNGPIDRQTQTQLAAKAYDGIQSGMRNR